MHDEIKCWNCSKVPSECMGMACCHYGIPAFLKAQADILSTPAEIKSDDAEVAALMMEADITAPIKEQASWVLAENDSLKAQLASAIAQLKEAKEQNSELTRKAKLYDGYFVMLAQCLHDVKV